MKRPSENSRTSEAVSNLIGLGKTSIQKSYYPQLQKKISELKESEKRYRLLAENITDVIWMMDMELTYLYISPSIEQLCGYTAEEMLARNIETTFTAASQEVVFATVEEELEKSKLRPPTEPYFRNLELQHLHKDGSYVWVEIVASLIYNEKGETTNILGVTRNISERKKAEEEREKIQKQLIQAQKMEAIGTLAGGIAHDFNNILSAIFGYTELAQMVCQEDPELREDLEGISVAARRARELIKQILAFSRQSEQKKVPLQIALVISEALKLLRSSIPTSIEIKQDIASRKCVLSDATQIHQIVMNLCTNAYQAMRDTDGTILVSLKELEITADDPVLGGEVSPGDYLHLEVSDTGLGIAREIREKIFEPYFTTKKVWEGTGLGLAVVHGIVQNHGGYISVDSALGHGATFHVYLPTVESNTAAEDVSETSSILLGKSAHVLFVDDEVALMGLAKKMFTRYGYRISTFSDPVQALESFTAEPDQYDLIITDMSMPHLTGDRLAKKVLQIRPNLPVILCTGYSEKMNKEKALALGIRKYFQKPLIMSELVQCVQQILEEGKA
ncbi:MAG: PAS domain S-box protein [Proteobacteria bacterium]|nr:PAS domain S-box protein [Pseudomonadota bacterium]MBU1060178.1 PAS domain S-box protein [Pseudomonadota bacterium]